jgi:hypothetical protein
MPQNVADIIRDCHRRAAECRAWATTARHAGSREHYLRMEERWLKLARSYEFTGQLSDFTSEVKRRVSGPAHTPLPSVECPRCGGTMRLARVESGIDLRAETVTLECECRYSLQQTVEPDSGLVPDSLK